MDQASRAQLRDVLRKAGLVVLMGWLVCEQVGRYDLPSLGLCGRVSGENPPSEALER